MTVCVDYQDVNEQTEKDFALMLQIDQVNGLYCGSYFACFDLLMQFHQIKVDPRDTAKIAFLTDRRFMSTMLCF